MWTDSLNQRCAKQSSSMQQYAQAQSFLEALPPFSCARRYAVSACLRQAKRFRSMYNSTKYNTPTCARTSLPLRDKRRPFVLLQRQSDSQVIWLYIYFKKKEKKAKAVLHVFLLFVQGSSKIRLLFTSHDAAFFSYDD